MLSIRVSCSHLMWTRLRKSLTQYAASIRSVVSTIAFGTMSYYNGNVSNNPLVRIPAAGDKKTRVDR
jgi:hypothetical protein